MRNTRPVEEIDPEELETDVRATGTREEDPGVRFRSLLRSGMTAADVGAGLGSDALSMAEAVGSSGRVIAVEPDPGDAQILRENAKRTRGARIEVIEAAAWSTPGELDLGRDPAGHGDHRVGPAAGERETVPVKAVRLDDVLPSRVDLISIDSQASEHVALRGAQRLLERSRPQLLVEFWPQGLREIGTDPVTVLDGYRAMGLRVSSVEGDLPSDPGELVLAIDSTGRRSATLRLEPAGPPRPAGERLLPAGRRLGRTWARRFPPTEPPRTLSYDATHRALVASVLDSKAWRDRFAAGAQLPAGLGAGFDERVVEYPWLFSRGLSGRVLDAGSVLNHRHVLERLLPAIDDLTIATLAPEPAAFNSFGVSYLYADLRALPLRDDWFDEVVCLSTLEHVGMDNTVYGTDDPRADDPRAAAAEALRGLLRVVRPGGRIHLSVPFGRREDHGWLRQLDREDVDALLADAGVVRHDETVFRHTSRGWRRATAKQAAGARYNDAPSRDGDGAVAAQAVLCTTIQA
jgi:FkbM family methyltransferase